MKRKIISSILLGLMTFSLASCTVINKTTDTNTTKTPETNIPSKTETSDVPGSTTNAKPTTTSNTPVTTTSGNIPTTTTGGIPTTTTGSVPTTTTGSTETTTSTTPINEHTVSFYSDGGLIDTKTVKDGEKVSAIADPVKESDGEYNYTFDCWYYNNAAFNFNTEIKEDIILTAKWNKTNIQYDFIIIDSISNSQIYSTKVNAKSKATEPTLPAKTGYTFIGFYTDTTYTTTYSFDTLITKKTTIYAKYESSSSTPSNINVTSYKGFAEGAYIEFDRIESLNAATDYDVYYLGPNNNDFVKINDNLVRLYNSYVRADIVGLEAGNYTLRIVANAETKDLTVKVTQDDRSGYAHFNYSGVGAYNDNGTVKENTTVVYVSEATKNTVTATIGSKQVTGLSNILKEQKNSSNPLIVRIIGDIGAPTWNKIDYANNINIGQSTSTKLADKVYDIVIKNNNGDTLSSTTDQSTLIANGYNTLDNSYEALNGLTSKINYGTTTKKINDVSYSIKDYDSYWNMLDIQNAKNVTIEGIGTDASITQWGLTWKNCTSIEVKNITFNNYPEDACSYEASDTSATTLAGFKTGYIWVHNNTFNEGKNNWDVCLEQDKHEGDGATDFKGMRNATISYNHYINNHKTGLVGGDGTHHQANFTFHHNWYQHNQARLPYGRQANMHMYNNYYDSSTGTNMQIHDGAYAFIENCYFSNLNKTFEVKTNKTTQVPAIKSYNNIFNNCKTYDIDNVTITTNREEIVSNDNIFDSQFDTNSTNFYYDATNKKSNVMIMNDASDLPTLLPTISGAGLCPDFNIDGESGSDTPVERFTVTFETNGGTAINSQSVISGNKISAVSTTKSGNTFVGWYTDQALTKSFDVTTPITKSITLYAKWETTSSDPQTGNTLTLTIPSETGEKTENFTAGDFTITATSDKKVNVNSNSISLNGGGSITYRSIVATVNTTNEITITINVSGGSNNRYLVVADENGTSLSETLVTGETLIIKASGHTAYYLYSKSSGLNVSTLTITY